MATKPSVEEVLEMLKLEAGMVADGAYNPSVRNPREVKTLFRDSPVCLNFGKNETDTQESCEYCWLMAFVPPADQNRAVPCHHIPLNAKGETIYTLEQKGDPLAVRDAVLTWLVQTTHQLENEVQGC